MIFAGILHGSLCCQLILLSSAGMDNIHLLFKA